MPNATYQKFTQCTSISGFVPVASGYFLSIIALIPVLAVALWLATSLVAIPVLIGVAVAIIAFCTYYLYHRLICLNPNQQCAIGVVVHVLRPGPDKIISKLGDNDATIDLLLAPGPTDYSQAATVYWQQVQGDLIKPQDFIVAAGLPYADPAKESASTLGLHCEFEGNGIVSLLAIAEVILALLVALLALTLLAPQLAPLILLLWLLLMALGAAGIFNDLFDPPAPSATDIQGNPGNLSPGDIVLVTGDWIYDGGHTGWNEIHAVHSCQIIGRIIVNHSDGTWLWPSDIGGGLGLDTPAKVSQALAMFCAATTNATVAVQGGTMTDPGNNWVIHPLVDGCNKSPVIV